MAGNCNGDSNLVIGHMAGDADALKALRLTPEALAAKVESLRITFAQWHTEMKPERQAAILREAFRGQV